MGCKETSTINEGTINKKGQINKKIIITDKNPDKNTEEIINIASPIESSPIIIQSNIDSPENLESKKVNTKKAAKTNNKFEIIHKEKVTSTMPESNQHIDELKLPKPFILNAVEQTAGKGQGNRQWKSSIIGNVYTTTCIPEYLIPEKLKNIPIFNKIVSLSIINELNKYEKGCFFVKQPNDILCKDGHKMGGILIKPYNGFYTIGFGVNLVGKPEDDQMREGGKKPCFLGEHIRDKNNIPKALDFSIDVSNSILNYLEQDKSEDEINKEYFSNELIANAIVGNAMKNLIKI